MTIFELVRKVLSDLYVDGKKQHGTAIDSKIVSSIDYLRGSYSKLSVEGRARVNYRDPAIRFAYVYMYVAAHGDYIFQVLKQLRAEMGEAIFGDKILRVSCLGGGPGSDIVAILKYLQQFGESEPVNKINCYLLDAEQAWADVWTELDESLDAGVALNTNFQPLDVTNAESWRLQKKFLQADLFTMSYFVSEVFALDIDGVVQKFWEQLLAEAKPGALFIYLDNSAHCFTSYFDKIWKAAGLESIVAEDNLRITPSGSEQASELAEYTAKFGYNPKIQARVAYRALWKPD